MMLKDEPRVDTTASVRGSRGRGQRGKGRHSGGEVTTSVAKKRLFRLPFARGGLHKTRRCGSEEIMWMTWTVLRRCSCNERRHEKVCIPTRYCPIMSNPSSVPDNLSKTGDVREMHAGRGDDACGNILSTPTLPSDDRSLLSGTSFSVPSGLTEEQKPQQQACHRGGHERLVQLVLDSNASRKGNARQIEQHLQEAGPHKVPAPQTE